MRVPPGSYLPATAGVNVLDTGVASYEIRMPELYVWQH